MQYGPWVSHSLSARMVRIDRLLVRDTPLRPDSTRRQVQLHGDHHADLISPVIVMPAADEVVEVVEVRGGPPLPHRIVYGFAEHGHRTQEYIAAGLADTPLGRLTGRR